MIVYDLVCSNSHRFEGWFGSSSDYEDQRERGLLSCPQCECNAVTKAPMAPAVSAKSNHPKRSTRETPLEGDQSASLANEALPAEARKALKAIAKMQSEAIKSSSWVGDKFADRSRAMHYGEEERKPIHGRATMKEAKELNEEGVAIAPLLIPVAPPDEVN